MRINVLGTSRAVPGLIGNLKQSGYHVTDQAPIYTVTVDDLEVPHIVVDIPDAVFGRIVTHAVAALAGDGGVYVRHRGGNLDDRAVVLHIPIGRDQDCLAVERGVVRALDQTIAIIGRQARQAVLLPSTAEQDPALALLVKHLVGVWDDLATQVTAQASQLSTRLSATLVTLGQDLTTQQALMAAHIVTAITADGVSQQDTQTKLLAAVNALIAQNRPRPWWARWWPRV